jgi:LytTr DNA-binding domain
MQTPTLIVDDETLARRRLSSLLSHEADFEVIGECAEGPWFGKRGAPPSPLSGRSAPDRMVVKSGDRLLFVPFDELDFIRSSANYVRLHLGRTVYAVRETIAAMESNLPADRFVRIHRSYIVNLWAIRELYHAGGGEYLMALRSGRHLPVGSTYPPVIRRALCTAGLPRFGSIGGI